MTDVKQELVEEQKRVDLVVKEVSKQIESSEDEAKRIKSDVLGLRKNFWQDVTVNLEEPDDVIETVASIKQQTELLAERERGFGQAHNRVKILTKLKQSPYFGRIDLLEEDETEVLPIYIGIASLLNKEEDDFLIYDWRAPISSVYYDFSPGPVSYKTPTGTTHGDMTLKRQYIIKDSRIESMFDTGITIGDELLQEVLGNQADSQMKSIVATIQKEQNQIIRNEKSKILVVQGVAGSGKTSAALQRVAYLLYQYRETLAADNIILFSPNPLFNSYVASVLPELGEENMQQTTFQNYLKERLENKFKLEDPFLQLEYVLTAMEDSDYLVKIDSIKFKTSLAFKKLIDDYVAKLGNEGIVFKNITFRNRVLISADVIEQQFYSYDSSISIPNRVKFLEEWILKEVRQLSKLERSKPWVEDKIQLLDKEDYLEAYKRTQKREHYNEQVLEQEVLEKLVINRAFKPIIRRIKKLTFIDIRSTYENIFKQAISSDAILPENWNSICDFTLQKLAEKELLYEDATPYLYMQDLIEGRKSNTLIRHLFIDEAQDYSAFQFAFLKSIFPNSKMTLLGDINQAIHIHSLENTNLSPEFGHSDKKEIIKLTKSYRSTRQIVDFTCQLITGGELIEAFNREGNKPIVTLVEDMAELVEKIKGQIFAYQKMGHKSIAVICKTEKESKEAFRELKEQIKGLQLIGKESTTFEKVPIVVPSYLAKGLEFDAVIIYNASNAVYGRENERKLFYTACTRAMHELHLFSYGETTPFLSNVEPKTYTCNQN